MIIRKEEERDYLEVEKLTRKAFMNVYRPGCFEHLVINKARNDKFFVKDLDYIIEEDGVIIANIIYIQGNLITEENELKKVLIFGPVSVLPEYQNKGYGKIIINYTLEKAKNLGYDYVIITGSPKYYQKFGFESCSKYGIYYQGLPKDEDDSFFMIKILNKNCHIIKGEYYDPECYNIDLKELEQFEMKFINCK